MGTYVIRRLTHSVPVIVIIGFLCFAIVRLAPGDPVALLVDVSLVPPADVERLRDDLGLTGPLPLQFGRMVAQLVTGQLRSLRTGQPVIAVLGDRFPVTATLLGAGIVLGTLTGSPWESWRRIARTPGSTTGCPSGSWAGSRCPASGWPFS